MVGSIKSSEFNCLGERVSFHSGLERYFVVNASAALEIIMQGYYALPTDSIFHLKIICKQSLLLTERLVIGLENLGVHSSASCISVHYFVQNVFQVLFLCLYYWIKYYFP